MISYALVLSAMLLVATRLEFSTAIWLGGRPSRAGPGAAALVSLVKSVVGCWWWTVAIAFVLFGVAAALLLGWRPVLTRTLAIATIALGLGRAAMILIGTRGIWRTSWVVRPLLQNRTAPNGSPFSSTALHPDSVRQPQEDR